MIAFAPRSKYFCTKTHLMKNGLLIWNSILTLAVVFLLVKQLGSGKKTTTNTGNISSENTFKNDGQFRIAYFEMDSVAAHFDLVKDLKTELGSKEEAINSEMARLSKNLQEKYNYYQTLFKNAKLTPKQEKAAKRQLDGLTEER